MNNATKNKMYHYINLAIKKRWLIIVPLCISMLAGIYTAISLPRIFEAETLILVESKKVPDAYVPSILTSDVRKRISTIQEQIKSRSYLEKMIEQHNLFSGPQFDHLFMEEKIERMRENIKVKTTASQGGMDSFKISFRGREPEKVMNVANSLASYFIDQSIKVMEDEVIGTSSFLDDELKNMQKNLEEHEERLRKYREEYMGGLPEQLDSILRNLDRLQMNLYAKQEGSREAKNRLIQIEKQIGDIQNLHEDSQMKTVTRQKVVEKDETVSENVLKLNGLKEKYNSLIVRYTEQHPDIIKLKIEISELEQIVANETKKNLEIFSVKQDKNQEVTSAIDATDIFRLNKTKYDLNRQHQDTVNEITGYEQDIARLQGQIKMLEKRAEDIPKRESELLSLKRDYENMKNSYDSLLESKLKAEIAVSMERKAKGERFRILDSAKKPQKPVSPDVRKLFILFMGSGLCLGCGLIYVLDFFDSSVKMPHEIQSMVDEGAYIITIPKIYSFKDNLYYKFGLVFSLFFIGIDIILFIGFGVLAFKGVDPTMEFLKRYIDIQGLIATVQ